jgi:hypothetical protein
VEVETFQRIRWAPFYVFFGVQRLFWWVLLKLLIPDRPALVDAKIEAKEGSKAPKLVLDEIYKFLGILDSKASALMRYNGIILAVIALMVRTGQPLPGVASSIVLMTVGSILACLLVVGVYWRFLEWIDPQAGAHKMSTELDMLRRVLILREAAYQVAWWLSAAVLIIFLIHFLEFLPSSQSNVTPKAG